nr:hypothetical protein [uncultured Mucilaginibacter sp.]
MKNSQNRSLAGLIFILLFIFNVSLVVIAVLKNDDLYIAYAILMSYVQFYLYHKFKISRFFFECDVDGSSQTIKHPDEKGGRYYDVNPN